MNPADIQQLSLPNTWEAFGALRDILLDEEPEFFRHLTAIWKKDPQFALEVASCRWKVTFKPIPHRPTIPAWGSQAVLQLAPILCLLWLASSLGISSLLSISLFPSLLALGLLANRLLPSLLGLGLLATSFPLSQLALAQLVISLSSSLLASSLPLPLSLLASCLVLPRKTPSTPLSMDLVFFLRHAHLAAPRIKCGSQGCRLSLLPSATESPLPRATTEA